MARMTISIPDDLKEQVQKMANEGDRSFTKQVARLLKKAIESK